MIVCSKSTRKYFPDEENVIVVNCGAPSQYILPFVGKFHDVIAVGGGAVIDTAKILSKEPIICYPTTAAGSSCTSHSVYWEGTKKRSLKRMLPGTSIIKKSFLNNIPDDVIEYTTYDVISHCLDSMWSKKKTKKSMYYVDKAFEMLRGSYENYQLVYVGELAGTAIELCPTTILHSLSYPLTGIYGVSHGKALGFLLPRICEFMEFDLEGLITPEIRLEGIDMDVVIEEAFTYGKMEELIKDVSIEMLKEVFK